MVNKLDNFTVYCSSLLSPEEVNVITLLYGPIIKKDAYNLYMFLSSLVDRANMKSFTNKHQFLFDMTLLNDDEFLNARIKLEAIGLLTTMYNNNSYIYILKSPFTAKQFFIDGILGTFLYSEIGQTSFKQLFKLFNVVKIPKESYDNITKRFDEVFVSAIDSYHVSNDDFLVGKNLNTGVKLQNFRFDYNKFLNNVKNLMDSKTIKSKKLETHLTNLAYAYSFDEDSLANVFRQSLTPNNEVDYALLNKYSLDEFHFQYNKSTPKMEVKTVDKLYNSLSNLTAEAILNKYSKFKTPLVDDVKKIAMIYQEFAHLDRAVINLCILKVLKTKDGEVPAYNYFKSALTNLVKNNLTNFDDVKQYYLGEGVKNTSKDVKKNPKNPKWLNEALDNIMDGVETL